MNRLQLIEEIRDILAKAGFYLSERHYEPGISFDVIARKDDSLLIIRALMNADSSRSKNATELKVLSNALNGSSLLIAVKGGRRKLKKGVIYSRRGLPLISVDTLRDMLIEGVPPYVFSAPGGFYVDLDSELLKKVREDNRISLSKLAKIAGVSRKAIQKYEQGMGADLEIALRLEEFLGEELILPLNPLEYDEEIEESLESLEQFTGYSKSIFESLLSMGYRIVPTCRCPFEAVTSDEKTILLSGIGSEENQNLKKKAKIVSDLSHITEKESVIFLKKRYTRVNLEGTPLIDMSELTGIDSKEAIKELLKERKEAK
ncbi:MAG: transcriptional regulator [Thermoplasmatota archaeon]